MDAGELIEPWPGLSIVALRAAHRSLRETEYRWQSRFLGYALTFREEGRDVSVIHSGDTIPFAGRGEEYRPRGRICSSLPANGRSEALALPRHRRQSDDRRGVTLTAESEAPAGFSPPTLCQSPTQQKEAEAGLPIQLIPARPAWKSGLVHPKVPWAPRIKMGEQAGIRSTAFADDALRGCARRGRRIDIRGVERLHDKSHVVRRGDRRLPRQRCR